MINNIISEWSKLGWKEYKTRHNWVGKVIHWELCKKLMFNYMNNDIYTQPNICAGKRDAQIHL